MLKLQTKALQDLIKVSLVWSDYTVPKIQLCRLKEFDIINIKISLYLSIIVSIQIVLEVGDVDVSPEN